jgi:hypothetical protein
LLRCSRIAVALHKRFDAIPIDAALAGVDVRVGAGPEEFVVSVFVVPPGKCDAVQLERGVEAIVLENQKLRSFDRIINFFFQ